MLEGYNRENLIFGRLQEIEMQLKRIDIHKWNAFFLFISLLFTYSIHFISENVFIFITLSVFIYKAEIGMRSFSLKNEMKLLRMLLV